MTALAGLIADLRELERLPLAERVPAARRLSGRARTAIGAAADAAVYEMTRGESYEDVAEALGASVKTLEQAVRRHRARERQASRAA